MDAALQNCNEGQDLVMGKELIVIKVCVRL